MRYLIAGLLLSSTAALANSFPEYPFVYVEGHAEREVAPNVGNITFSVWAADLKPEPAFARVQTRSAELLAALASQGIEQADVTSFEIEQSFEGADSWRGRGEGPPRYVVNRTFKAEVRKLESWSKVLSQLVGKPDVASLTVAFDHTDRKVLERELEQGAAEDARQQGQRIAQAFGQKLGPATAISRIAFDRLPAVFGTDIERLQFARLSSEPAKKVSADLTVPATIVVEQRFNVLFRLK